MGNNNKKKEHIEVENFQKIRELSPIKILLVLKLKI